MYRTAVTETGCTKRTDDVHGGANPGLMGVCDFRVPGLTRREKRELRVQRIDLYQYLAGLEVRPFFR
jgi:hypothetical protein